MDGFINIKNMYNNDVGKGGVYAYEAHGVKSRVALVGVPFYFRNIPIDLRLRGEYMLMK